MLGILVNYKACPEMKSKYTASGMTLVLVAAQPAVATPFVQTTSSWLQGLQAAHLAARMTSQLTESYQHLQTERTV